MIDLMLGKLEGMSMNERDEQNNLKGAKGEREKSFQTPTERDVEKKSTDKTDLPLVIFPIGQS